MFKQILKGLITLLPTIIKSIAAARKRKNVDRRPKKEKEKKKKEIDEKIKRMKEKLKNG